MTVGLEHVLVLSAVLFGLGMYGALSRKNAVHVMMSLELMANSVNLSLVGFSRFLTPGTMDGQFFAAFSMVVSAAEIGIGLALVIAIYRRKRSVELDAIQELKG